MRTGLLMNNISGLRYQDHSFHGLRSDEVETLICNNQWQYFVIETMSWNALFFVTGKGNVVF
jgi:hypothetical protein